MDFLTFLTFDTFLSRISDISVSYMEVWHKSESNSKYESPRSLQDGLNGFPGGVYPFTEFSLSISMEFNITKMLVFNLIAATFKLLSDTLDKIHNHIRHKTKAE